MRFLLVAINAKYIHSNPAIYSLRAYAGESASEHVELAEYTINQSLQDILADIYAHKPDAIGFSCYIWNWITVQNLLNEIPKILPDAHLWLGGPEVSYDPENIRKKYPFLKGIMIGEGEETFREVLEFYLQKEKADAALERIPGLYLESGFTPMRAVMDISKLPFLYYNLAPFQNKIIYYESGRGCPFKCSYCLSSIEKSVRLRDMETVKKELQFFLDNNIRQVKFVDRTFNCNHDHAMGIWQYIKDHDNGITNFHFEISADILREDEIKLLNTMRPGLVQLEIGVQTVNAETLKAIHRVMDINRLEKIVEAVSRGKNIHQHLDLIAGLPYENYNSFKNSFNRVYEMHPEQLQLGFLKVLKGSEMCEKAEEYGIRYLENPPYEVLSTNWISYEEIRKLKAVEEMVELYYNSGQFTHTLPVLEKTFSNPFELFEKLAEFYEEKGYYINTPARAYRYQVLLEFTERFDKDRAALYIELLTLDIYLRENMKCRPEFSEDISPFKEAIKKFFEEEEKTRKYLPEYRDRDWKQLSRMTHVEPFHYSVWEKIPKPLPTGKTFCLLFDYQSRNPLNYEARSILISLPEEEL